MHETAIAQSILDIARQHLTDRGFLHITRVVVSVGRLSSVVPESLEFAFRAMARGTEAEDAALEIREVDAEACCRSCGSRFSADGFFVICEACGSVDVEIAGGDELTIESIEITQ